MGKSKRPAQPQAASLAATSREEIEAVRPRFERALDALEAGREPAAEDLAAIEGTGSSAALAAQGLLAQLPETRLLRLIELFERLGSVAFHELVKEASFSEEFSLDVKAAMVALLERWQDPQAYLHDEIEQARGWIARIEPQLDAGPLPAGEREQLHQAVRGFSSFTRQSFARQIVLDLGARAARAFELLHGADSDLDNQLLAIIESLRAPQAAQLLATWLTQADDKAQRKAIKRALHKLESAGVPLPELDQPRVVLAPAPRDERRAHSSHIDSLGDRLLWYARVHPPEGLVVVQALVNDRAGLGNFEIFKSSRKGYRQMLADMKTDPLMMVIELDPDHALRLIDRAAARSRELGKEVPEDFARHRELLGTGAGEPESAPIYRRFESEQIEPLRHDRARAAAALELSEIRGWMIHVRDLEPYFDRIMAAQKSPIITSELSKSERLAGLYRDVTDEFFSSESGAPYRGRLEEMAELYAAAGRLDDARAALAAALSLTGAPHDSPFAAGLMSRCLDLVLELQKKNQEGSLIVSPYDSDAS